MKYSWVSAMIFIHLASCVLKQFENQGRRASDLPLVEWSVRTLMYSAQEALHSFLRNFPNRPVAAFLRFFISPRGRTYSSPSDDLGKRIVDLVTRPGEARERLSQFAYTTKEPGNPLGLLQDALELSVELGPLEGRLRQARKEGLITSDYLGEQIDQALAAEVIGEAEATQLRDYHEKATALMAVDDFDPAELGRKQATSNNPRQAAKRKPAPRKKTAARKKTT